MPLCILKQRISERQGRGTLPSAYFSFGPTHCFCNWKVPHGRDQLNPRLLVRATIFSVTVRWDYCLLSHLMRLIHPVLYMCNTFTVQMTNWITGICYEIKDLCRWIFAGEMRDDHHSEGRQSQASPLQLVPSTRNERWPFRLILRWTCLPP